MPKTTNQDVINNIKKVAKSLAGQYQVKIGLLASQGASEEISENMDLAGLGAVQEFGADIKITKKMAAFLAMKAKELGLPKSNGKGDGYVHIPARSWLYAPLMDKNFKKTLYEYIGDFDLFAEAADDDLLKDLADKIGLVGIYQIQKAFENHGINGEWPENSPMTIASKGSSMQLVNEGNFRKHVTYEISNS